MGRQFNIENVEFKIVWSAGEEIMVGISTDGFGVTPGAENTMIEGLKAHFGFNIDPKSPAEATVSLLTGSTSNKTLFTRFEADDELTITITDSNFSPVVVRTIPTAIIQKPPEYSSDENEEPTLEWTFIGYGYTETHP